MIKTEHKDDFEEILPIYIITETGEEADKVVSQMDRSISKSTNVIKYHSMKIENKERCRWIDDNYMAVAKANFYKREYAEADRIFEFVTREFKPLPTKYDAQFWLSRTYIEEGKLDEAGLLLSAAAQDKDMPPKKLGEFHKAYAHYYIQRENYTLAADQLLKAIPYEKKKRNRNRLNFILAQLYQRAGKPNDAIRYFEMVAQKSNDYAMVFNSRIYQATNVQNKVSGYKVKEDLMKMLKDDKNIEFQDQIYYALGEISMKERKPKEGLDYYKKSAEVSTTNVKQKSRSFLRVAKYYFDQKLYSPAQVFYDSAVTVLPPNFPEAEQIKLTSANLNELVAELNTVTEQDSLLALSALSPKDLDKRLTEITRDLQKQADDAAALQAVKESIVTIPKSPSSGSAAPGAFYFYNDAAKNTGIADFKKKWGGRKLEDNWRRKNKIQADGGNGGFDDPTTPDSSSAIASNSGVVIRKDDLKKNIPVTTDDINAAHNKIIESLYASGNIYKEKFRDNENAIEAFANLVQRYDTSRYEATAYYQLYRLYLQKENTKKDGSFFSLDTKSSSAYYRDLILTEYPGSEFARLVENPEYLKNAAANVKSDMADYARVYQLYKQASYTDALMAADSLIIERPASPISAKFFFLKSRIQAELHNVDGMVSVLTAITVKFPKTQESAEAQRILDILKTKMPAAGMGTDSTKAKTPADSLATTPVALSADFKADEASEHYMGIVFPSGVDQTGFKPAITTFNTANFNSLNLTATSTFIDNDNQLIIVKAFPNKTEAMNYYKSFMADKKTLKLITGKPETKVFVITVENFITLFKQKKVLDYMNFFNEKYLK